MSAHPRTLWFIVTPVYKPAPGGGAIYTDILGRALVADGADVLVITEAFPGEAPREQYTLGQNTLTIDRTFPMRAGRAKRDWRSYFAYAGQNFDMLSLPARLRKVARAGGAERVVVLIHSSFFYNWSLLPIALAGLRQVLPGRTTLIVDVRDPLVSERHIPLLSRFDSAIGCSKVVADKLRDMLPASMNVAHIPIPFERPPLPSETEVAATQAASGLEHVRYVLNPNGISERKRYPEMLKIVRALRTIPGYEDVVLATLGRARDWNERDDAAVAEGVLRYVGVVPNSTALALARGAVASIILSRIEGMPRAALEALALGTPLLAPDIPEFREHLPSSVVASSNPHTVARQLVKIAGGRGDERYPIEAHDMTKLVRAYRALEPETAPLKKGNNI